MTSETPTIVNDDGAGVGMSAALREPIGLWRLVALEGEVLHAVGLGRRLLCAFLGCIDRVAAGHNALHRGDGHGGLR